MGDVKVSVSLTLDDNMSAEATKALRDLVAAADKSGRASAGMGKAAAQAGKDGAASTGKYVAGLRSAAAQSNAAATAARAQAAATRETARQYEHSARAARVAARAQKELADSVRKTDGTSLTRLSRAMDALAAKGRAIRAGFGGFARNAAMGVAQGVGQRAAASIQGLSLRPAIDYERRLAMMANTAFADRKTVAGRQAGMQEIRAAVDAALNAGGGSRDAAAEALDFMIASGSVGVSDAMKMLPTIQKFATGTGAASTELAGIAMRGIQQGFFTADQVEAALNNALVAGQEGGFELKDMARWLPQLMANAQGMKSMEGFKTILAAAQASVTTAGDTDQAGNNLVNLLAKLNSRQLSDALKNKNNINLAGTLAAARENGQLPLEAFMELLNREVVGKNKQFQALQARAKSATGEEKEKLFADMGDIVQASSIGEVLADRQATMALVALMNNPAYLQQVMGAMANSSGAIDTNFATVQATTSARAEQVGNARDAALQSTFDKLAPTIKLLADGVTSAANTFPAVTTAATAAAAALGSLAAFAGAGYLLRGRAAAGAGAAVRGGKARRYRTGKSAPASAKQRAGASLARGAKARLGGAAGALALGGLNIAATENDETLTREEKNIAHAESAGGVAGALALGAAGAAVGAKGGAVVGTFVGGPLGTAIGAILGSVAGLIGSVGGHYLGSLLGKKTGEAVYGGKGQPASTPSAARPGLAAAGGAAMPQLLPTSNAFPSLTGPRQMSEITIPAPKVTNHINVTIDGREVFAAMEERLERLDNRGD